MYVITLRSTKGGEETGMSKERGQVGILDEFGWMICFITLPVFNLSDHHPNILLNITTRITSYHLLINHTHLLRTSVTRLGGTSHLNQYDYTPTPLSTPRPLRPRSTYPSTQLLPSLSQVCSPALDPSVFACSVGNRHIAHSQFDLTPLT